MKKPFLKVFVAALAALSSLPAVAQTTTYILETQPTAPVGAIASNYQLSVIKSWVSGTQLETKVTSAQPLAQSVISAIRSQAGVLDFEADATIPSSESDSHAQNKGTLESLGTYAFTPTAVNYYGAQVRSGYVAQPATQIIELSSAQQKYGTGAGTVAIIDTGVDPNHPALQQVLLPGYDFTRDQAGTASELADLDQSTVAILDQSTVAILDSKNSAVVLNQSTVAILDQSTVALLDGNLPKAFGHGTMVAGLVHLVAPTARILPLKAFHADGTASLSDIVRAVRYAADQGANVISMSFTFSSNSADLKSAIQYAQSKGAICVASAGNDASENKYYPASLPGVFGVGSTNFSDVRSPFSNHDDSADTSAPGEAIVTTYPGNNYAGVWGTSFSSALVAGAVAVFQQVSPHISQGNLQDAIDSGVHINQDMGDARLDLAKSLASIQQSH